MDPQTKGTIGLLDLVRLYDNLQRLDIAVKQEIKIGSYGSAVLLTCGNNITHTHIRYKSFKNNGVVWHRSITKDNNFLITRNPCEIETQQGTY